MSNENKEFAFLENIKTEKIWVSVYLTSGIRLEGYIADFDDNCLFLDSDQTNLVYKQTIAKIVLNGKLVTARYAKTAS